MRHHSSPSVLLSEKMSLDGFRDGSNLVDLQEETVASLLIGSSCDSFWVGHREIVTNNLDSSASCHFSPVLPIVLL